ncbi:DNA replication and repair protein RecN [Hasllibacter halocynthiae]|uniref:DNA repair protein RecN n=1 Tax=Hasllibacter halocynthiae TaxID=595589 RepID=A0A2T0X9G9_9RHOB|nr:DNA repair protein RecN [Hasllibacter halocynthiae]PRY95567.1 DNA replication and repair protein RecN [Hasllibacter halocynthiae]
MLRSLEIKDMLLIDRLSLEMGEGLNVLTGETGAGKSILLDSLGFVLGWRGRAELVRAGAERGEVTAAFDLPKGHPAEAVLEKAGIEPEDELIFRRVNTADGRKTAWVNGIRVSGEVLRRLSDTLVELHGQHDDRGLLHPAGHRALLDAFAGADLASVRAAWAARRAAAKTLAEAEEALQAARKEEEFVRHAADELSKMDPRPGEDEALDARRRLMQASARIREDIAKAGQAISYDGAEGQTSDAIRWLGDGADAAEGRLDAPIAALERALEGLAEAQQGIEDALHDLAFDPRELEETEERLFALRALARKHGVTPEELPALAEDMNRRLEALDRGEGDIADLRAALRVAETAYGEAAAALSARRHEAAAALDAAMAAELAPLKMERAVFETRIAPSEPGPDGADEVAFTVATNPGAPAGPLAKIASGGELSRFLLALKVCLTGGATGITMIFDEIDRGVGGATADAVGRRLAAIAAGAQVLVVTHSPQVAALGAHHWRVEKRVEADVTVSTVTALDPARRVEEIARMLSGETITPAARDAAQALLTA